MARLGAPASVNAWALVTLTVIVCLGNQFSSANEITDRLKHSLKGSTEHRTDDDWKKLGTAALEEIQKRNGRVSGDVKEWLKNLAGFSRIKDCSNNMAADLVSWRSVDKKLKKFHAVLGDYLKLYLDECGFEERFKAAIDKLKQGASEKWTSGKDQTLRKYLKARAWSVSEAKELLSVVDDILDLGRNTGKTDCTDKHMNSLVGKLISGKLGIAPEFMDGYVRLYLDKCGYASRFEEAINTLKRVDSEHWSADKYKTLHGYLKTRGPYYAGGTKLFSVVDDILQLDGNPDKADCTDEFLIELVTKRLYLITGDILWFHEGYGGLYLKKCGFDERFKRAIGALKQVSPGFWSSYPHRTMYAYLKEREWFRHSKGYTLSTVRDVLSIVNNILKLDGPTIEADCSAEHMINVLKGKIDGLQDDKFRRALNDYVKLYLKKCRFEWNFQRAIHLLKQISPDYWSQNCYKTLYGYLNRQNPYYLVMELQSIVGHITKLDSINQETDCTDDRMITVAMMRFHRIIPQFLDDYSELYSRKCGFENLFKRAIENVESVSSKHWQSAMYPSLVGYLRFNNHFIEENLMLHLLSAIREISKPESIKGEIDCSEKRVAQVSNWFADRLDFDCELCNFLGGYLKFYLEKCAI